MHYLSVVFVRGCAFFYCARINDARTLLNITSAESKRRSYSIAADLFSSTRC